MAAVGAAERSSVNICGYNAPEWVIAFMGGVFANCIPAGVYATNSPDACLYVAQHSEAEIVVCADAQTLSRYEKILPKLSKIKAFIIYAGALPAHLDTDPRFYTWKAFLALGRHSTVPLAARTWKQRPGMCANIVYTSGTTGPPKGVLLSHDNLLWTSNVLSSTVAQELNIFNERIVSYLPLSHIAAQISDIYANLCHRTAVFFAPPDALRGGGAALVATLRKVRPTQFLGVPRVWEKIEERIREEIAASSPVYKAIAAWALRIGYLATRNQLRGKQTPICFSLANFLVFKRVKKALGLDRSVMNFFGAAPLKKSTRAFFASLNLPLLNCYGMSETSGLQTGSLPLPHWNKMDATGTPLFGTHLKIDKARPEDKEGEVCFRGRNVFMGYLKDEAETRRTLDAEGFAHSGDLGFVDEEGFLHLTGRIKELIITAGGQNVAPVPI